MMVVGGGGGLDIGGVSETEHMLLFTNHKQQRLVLRKLVTGPPSAIENGGPARPQPSKPITT